MVSFIGRSGFTAGSLIGATSYLEDVAQARALAATL